jgi:vacuolar-type H+-ATPase subunit E/Vma4
MEGQVIVQCRLSDQALVEEVLEEAGDMYRDLMLSQVKKLKGKTKENFPLVTTLDKKNWLPEYNPEEESTKTGSCVGGVRLHARKGRIVCSNTLDDRLELCYQEAIPQIRVLLFPEYTN